MSHHHETSTADRRALTGAMALLVVITALHYLTPPDTPVAHDVYRRLYYLPIVWAALARGFLSGIIAATLATAAYVPHAFLLERLHDPAPGIQKTTEILLYFAVAALAGVLVDRERRARGREVQAAVARRDAEARADRLDSLVHFSRGLAHEIRNPLGGIQGAIEILAEAVPSGGPHSEMIEVGLRETERLNRVLTDFLVFARPREPEMHPFPVQRMLGHAAEVCRSDAVTAGIDLQTEGAVSGVHVRGDEEQLVQVLINLVRNAVQAGSRGGRVRVRARRFLTDAANPAGSARVEIAVLDDGPGVPADLGDAIYDPYVTSRDEGSGLGLPVAATIVRAHGGTLGHDRSDDGWTAFRFRLPETPAFKSGSAGHGSAPRDGGPERSGP